MHRFIFTGPTLTHSTILNLALKIPTKRFSSLKDALNDINLPEECIIVVPPVSGGDLFSMRNHLAPYVIAIIDGYFENSISIWHKEILYLLSKKIPIYGSSSMGALRASEMAGFGMVGVGKIYENFANGIYEDDDEVTINHGPAEAGFPNISEAMVNIRYTIESALKENVISEDVAQRFISVAKSTFYKKRNYGYIIRQCVEYNDMKESDFSKFVIWLEKYRIDQKKIDAIKLVKIIESLEHGSSYSEKSFIFEDTVMWRNAIAS
jgi:hypothetical protein